MLLRGEIGERVGCGALLHKVGSSLISAVFCFVLACPFALFFTTKLLEVELPNWMTAEEAAYLAGGVTHADIHSKANIESFTDGSFQDSLEKEIGNFIPAKAAALFGDSLRQRLGIEASNLLFRWVCYPTFYGSDYVYIPTQDALTWTAAKEGSFDFEGFDRFFEQLNGVSQSHPSIEFVVFMTDPNNDLSPLNPSKEYVSEAIGYSDLVGRLSVFAQTAPTNLTIMHGGGYANLQKYYTQHYTCDIHWNIEGMITACEELCRVLGNPALEFDQYAPVDQQMFCGDVARRALYPLSEPVSDTKYDFSNLEGREKDGSIIDLGIHQKYVEANELNRLYNFYGLYFEVETEMVITGGVGERNTLLIGDSFARSLARPLAESSATLFQNPALFGDISNYSGLREHLAIGDIDSVVFVGTPANLASFSKRNPDFFAV